MQPTLHSHNSYKYTEEMFLLYCVEYIITSYDAICTSPPDVSPQRPKDTLPTLRCTVLGGSWGAVHYWVCWAGGEGYPWGHYCHCIWHHWFPKVLGISLPPGTSRCNSMQKDIPNLISGTLDCPHWMVASKHSLKNLPACFYLAWPSQWSCGCQGNHGTCKRGED